MKNLVSIFFIGLIIVGCRKDSEIVSEKSPSENIDASTTKTENCIP